MRNICGYNCRMAIHQGAHVGDAAKAFLFCYASSDRPLGCLG
jgi:hypothetical protein